jgi:probable phosphoglycerate mutase
VATGAADPELSEIGIAQADRLARWLATEHVDAVYTSPMLRAVQTADPIGLLMDRPPVAVDDIAEWDRHAGEYVPVEELKASGDPRWRALVEGRWEGDEPEEHFSARVRGAMEGIIAGHPGGRVVVVCHGGVINDYLAHVLGLAVNRFFYPEYTSVHRIAASRDGHRGILAINETAHLRGTDLHRSVARTPRGGSPQ